MFAVILGFALLIERNDNDLLAHVSQSSGELGALGIGALIVGVIQLLVAIGLWRGNDFARILAGIVCFFQLAGGVYVLVAYEGSLRWQGSGRRCSPA